MSRKALLVGINYIGTRSELRGCINDVKHVEKFLLTQGFQKSEMKILIETDSNPENHPTRKNIINAIGWLIKDNNSKSRLFMHYSGHGGSVRDVSGDERDGRDETICPLDYAKNGQIIDDDLRGLLVDPLVKGSQLTAIFDCCHSGTALDLRYNYQCVKRGPRRLMFNIISDEKQPRSAGDVLLFSGCMDPQTSADAWEEGISQGAMTYAFLKSYKRLNVKSKRVSYKRFLKNLVEFLKKKGYPQTPQISAGRYLDINAVLVI